MGVDFVMRPKDLGKCSSEMFPDGPSLCVLPLTVVFIHSLPVKNLPLRLKWPNDIYTYYEGQLMKVGGILIETLASERSEVTIVNAGIYMNTMNRTCIVHAVQVYINGVSFEASPDSQ